MVGRISSPRFVGRVAELDVLQRALARASSGTGTAVLVAGEAGIGKSRLVSEIEVWARGREALVLIGECVELAEGELAFAPIISALRGVIEDGGALEGLEGPMRSALGALWPVAGADVGVDTGREQLFEAVYRVLARLAREQAVLLIVEDVHWIDPSSRDLLTLLVRNARHDRIAVVVTYRPDELHRGHPLRPFVAELERSGRAERLELEPLERSEVAEQLEAIAGRAPAAGVVDGIFVRSEGNPFFAEELLAGAGAGGGELPGSLREALLLRVERLSTADARGVARGGSRRAFGGPPPPRRGDRCRPRRSCWPRFARRPTTTCWCRARADWRTGSAMRCCARRSTTTPWSASGCGCIARSLRRWSGIATTPVRARRPSWPTTGWRRARCWPRLSPRWRLPPRPTRCMPTARRSGTSGGRSSCGIG